jgi:formylglycine-generating enzyme required for sulfatase activity
MYKRIISSAQIGVLCLGIIGGGLLAQTRPELVFNPAHTAILAVNGHDVPTETPLFTFRVGDPSFQNRRTVATTALPAYLELSWEPQAFEPAVKGRVTLTNRGADTIAVDNFLPFGKRADRVYITGQGDHPLSRTYLFRPGYEPVNVIVPDNLWNLGFTAGNIAADQQLTGLMRRDTITGGQRRRFETLLFPGGSVTYDWYCEAYTGDWQEGLKQVFQERYLYDVVTFDSSLYAREDLSWIRKSYAMHLIMAWDKIWYDGEEDAYVFRDFLVRGRRWYGGDDVIGLWPTWPTLGLDQRNQWDLFRDLPGGMRRLRELADSCRAAGTRFFISYNPWDQSTRHEDHYAGMADLIARTGADGVVLDTQGSSSAALQAAADGVKSGVVMYSEGMAVPRDMQGIVSGRVHNALYYPPLLNLNKLIRPDFAIFRVAELQNERIRREYALSFFNGYGTELNVFRPGRPDWIEADYRFFGETVRILRENSRNFTSRGYRPLVPTEVDSVYVNRWSAGDKTIYTIFSRIPQGYVGPLFAAGRKPGYHYVDLWNHLEIEPDEESRVPVDLAGFSRKWLGTNNEGAVGAIGHFPNLITLERQRPGVWRLSVAAGDEVWIWAGHPAYDKDPVIFPPGAFQLDVQQQFGDFRGKYVIQVFAEEELIDERVLYVAPGTALLASHTDTTASARQPPPGMVAIPAGTFTWTTTHGDNFIPVPEVLYPNEFAVPAFYLDRHPVTNAEFARFLDQSGYRPADTTNFLRHWENGRVPAALREHPVVYVSYEDARAYAQWAGKRLPAEWEWQYAAQTEQLHTWPWGAAAQAERSDQYVTNTLTVRTTTGLDSTRCNVGTGVLDPVGSYPRGRNPYGLEDLVGSVWQLTNDVYRNDSYRFVILKGGSYFSPGSSWWYVQGGPRELTYREKLLLVGPGFERNATVGFRCVRDK